MQDQTPLNASPKPYTFRNRKDILDQLVRSICRDTGTDARQIIVISGEAGIGKSRVLSEARARIREKTPEALIWQVDCREIAGTPDSRTAFIRAVIRQSEERLRVIGEDVDTVAAQVVTQLNRLSLAQPVALFFDTTERLQSDRQLWQWLENRFLLPLITEKQVCVVFAGRIAPPLPHYSVRSAMYHEDLDPIERDPAYALTKEIVARVNADIDADAVKEIFELVHATAHGHPLLVEEMARYVAVHWGKTPTQDLHVDVCRDVIQPFVRAQMLAGLQTPWDELMPWITILRRFDAAILKSYLEKLAPDLVADKPDYFYTEGIGQLKIRNRVIWEGMVGFHVIGVLSEILRHCLRIQRPDTYRQACAAAIDTFQEIADTFQDDEEQAQPYIDEADYYRMQIQEMERSVP